MEGNGFPLKMRLVAPVVAIAVVAVTTVLVVATALQAWNAASTTSDRIAITARLLVTFLIPVAAITGYRIIVRQQNRHAHRSLETKLEAERELSKAKDALITGISGELRSPLTTILGFSELLVERGIVDPSEAMELVELINQDSVELARMVEDLVVASWLDEESLTYEPETVDIIEALEEAAAPIRRAGRTVNVRGRKVTVWADPIRVRQIARNLLSNALNHGGPCIEIAVAAQDDDVLCTFADDGPGLPAETEAGLWERPERDGRPVLLTGTKGMGLAIAKALAMGMGGDLGYGRTLGWTSFLLRLPRVDTAGGTDLAEAMPEPGEWEPGRDPADALADGLPASRANHLRALKRAFAVA
ncbi:MAG: HAMP domain-containing sensor histidine kinase, partial [Acidimicrobiia bacterium]